MESNTCKSHAAFLKAILGISFITIYLEAQLKNKNKTSSVLEGKIINMKLIRT